MIEAWPGPGRRGQPLLGLGLLLGGWVVVRVLTWQPMPVAGVPVRSVAQILDRRLVMPGRGAGVVPVGGQRVRSHGVVRVPQRQIVGARRLAAGRADDVLPVSVGPAVPPEAAGQVEAVTGAAVLPGGAGARLSRWSGSAWLLWRPGGGDGKAALPSYGASQAGAVVRYRLGAEPLAPYAYLRGATALAGQPGVSADADLAVGFGIRPLRRVPVRALVEIRADRLGEGRVHARAAALAVSEFPPVALPGGANGEAYVQAGYVAGLAGTGFVDGALRVERRLVGFGPVVASAGGVFSGGAQQGAGRLDIGPAVTLAAISSRRQARATLEWRFRLAGDARPGSGPAFTVIAGF